MVGLNSFTVDEKLIFTSCGIIFIMFLLSASPSIAGGDSGELVAEGCSLGTAHPPGYPLFTVLTGASKKFGFAIFDDVKDNVAYRMNVISCLLTAGAAGFVGMIVQMAVPDVPFFRDKRSSAAKTDLPFTPFVGGSIVAMGMFAFSPLIWQYAVTAEVFPLNTFFTAWILYLVLSFAQTGKFSTAVCGAFVCGLALTNQHTIVLYEAPLMLWMAWLLRHHFSTNIMHLLKLAGAFFLGLSLYLYLPLSAIIYPESKGPSWGDVGNWSGFWHHFLRKDYGTLQLYSGSSGKNTENFQVRTYAYIKDVTNTQGLYIASTLAVIGSLYWCWEHYIYIYKSKSRTENPNITPASVSDAEFEAEFSIMPEQNKKSNKTNNKSCKSNSQKSPPTSNNSQGSKFIKNSDPSVFGDCSVLKEDTAWTPIILIVTQCFYFAIFHSLSNLPLGDKLLFGVHQRFWMQPNVLLFAWVGVGFNATNYIFTLCKIEDKGNRRYGALCSLTVGLLIVCTQYAINFNVSNQSGQSHFRSYAQAILDPLPKDSLLLVNYDMQWTSLRYISQCEKYRPDVTLINLSMMTYTWFHKKIKHFPNYQ